MFGYLWEAQGSGYPGVGSPEPGEDVSNYPVAEVTPAHSLGRSLAGAAWAIFENQSADDVQYCIAEIQRKYSLDVRTSIPSGGQPFRPLLAVVISGDVRTRSVPGAGLSALCIVVLYCVYRTTSSLV